MSVAHNTAPKGRNKIAQGNALGYLANTCFLALKGRNTLCSAPSGRGFIFVFMTQGVALGYFILTFQGNGHPALI
jgi:hypothetical protein